MAAFQSTLTDFSSAYSPATGLYFGAPIWQLAAASSASSSSSITSFSVIQKQAVGSASGSSSSTGVKALPREATGYAVGSYTVVISGPTQLRLGGLSDFSFPFLNGGRFYLGPAQFYRTATSSGSSLQSSTFIRGLVRSASGSGSAGESTSTDLEIIFRSATGSATSSGEGDPFLFVIRQGSSAGIGSSSVSFIRGLLRSSIGSGNGASIASRKLVAIRTATGSAVGSSNSTRHVLNIRYATGSAGGSSTSTSIESLPRTASGSGLGATSGNAVGYKFHMFRPPTQNDVPTQLVGGDRIANRLARFYAPGQRGKNVYKLVDSTFTEIDQHDYSVVEKVYHGGHVHTLTEEEYTDLLSAGYSEYLT